MRPDLFYPTPLGEGRLLLLIDAFSDSTKSLEGRTKLAKLDFFLRYPAYLGRALAVQGVPEIPLSDQEKENVEARMVRYKFGPWDPAYYSLLGTLIGKGLVEPVPLRLGIGYRTTATGRDFAERLSHSPGWTDLNDRCRLLRRYMDRTGSWLKNFVYEHFPEVAAKEQGALL